MTSEGEHPTGGEKSLRGPEIRGVTLEAKMAEVLSSPRLRLVLPGEALELLLELARRVDLNRAGLARLTDVVGVLVAQRPALPVGQKPPFGRDG